jgi:cysteinyl-tRNA synthetase
MSAIETARPAVVRPVGRHCGAAALCIAALLLVPSAAEADAKPAAQLAAARSWGYQLQNVEPRKLEGVPYDVIVIDYSRDGSDFRSLSPLEIENLKRKPDGSRRIVLCYFSIGEAEDYRYYWKWYWGWFGGLFAPSWRGKHNRQWRGNYAVRFWMEPWHRILYTGQDSYLDRIIRSGYDGVWLDRIDIHLELARENLNARADMITLVLRIAERARSLKPGFLVVPQNGEELLTESHYRRAIDAIGKEDLLYGEEREKRPNRPDEIAARIAHLKLLKAEGKPVLTVEYLDAPADIRRAGAELRALGFLPHFADRMLESMRIGDLPEGAREPGRRR